MYSLRPDGQAISEQNKMSFIHFQVCIHQAVLTGLILHRLTHSAYSVMKVLEVGAERPADTIPVTEDYA